MPVLIHFYDKPALYRYSSILHRYVYTQIYTYLCTYIYFPEGMFTYFFLGDSAALELGGKDGKRAGALLDSDPTSLIRAIQLS